MPTAVAVGPWPLLSGSGSRAEAAGDPDPVASFLFSFYLSKDFSLWDAHSHSHFLPKLNLAGDTFLHVPRVDSKSNQIEMKIDLASTKFQLGLQVWQDCGSFPGLRGFAC